MIGSAIADTLPNGLRISRGSIEFDGLTLTDMNPKTRRDLLGRDIGFIPQEPMTALNPTLTIGQQVGSHLARVGFGTARKRQERAIELFTEVGLNRPADLLRSYPHQLSGGMLQRVLIAMAFASNPRLVIADEPTTDSMSPSSGKSSSLSPGCGRLTIRPCCSSLTICSLRLTSATMSPFSMRAVVEYEGTPATLSRRRNIPIPAA